MVNQELIGLCRTLVAAIQDSDSFDARYLRRLILHVVPQLLVEIDILAGMIEAMPLPVPEPELPAVTEATFEAAAEKAVESRPQARSRRTSRKKKRKARR